MVTSFIWEYPRVVIFLSLLFIAILALGIQGLYRRIRNNKGNKEK